MTTNSCPLDDILRGTMSPASAPRGGESLSDHELDRIALTVADILEHRLGHSDQWRTWLDVKEVAARARLSPLTVTRLLREGRMHGHQAIRQGQWRAKGDAVDAFLQNATFEQQRTACGCPRFDKRKR
ncbi:helix-turn-helix domain-containing protein [Pseudonocardia sp. WMMC193]|uniref:helix-turn-helix domain-containing protein n=1 Tax=Pseudonocardia sp. WMMC193 TaxID=2911965 RepID=UPI001F2C29F8|nr:helix-turn-helix domain-containing protein [Pseudonocardia sp. WMMC193]MCF7548889.1 helix-turn-helix domain-containing protein [Pseudonocardia sp. WMMC193]